MTIGRDSGLEREIYLAPARPGDELLGRDRPIICEEAA